MSLREGFNQQPSEPPEPHSCPRLPRSALVVSFDTRRIGGLERLALDIVNAAEALGIDCSIVEPRRLWAGWLGRQLGRARFILALLREVRSAEVILCTHRLFLPPIRFACRSLPKHRRPKVICWLAGIEVWGRALKDAAPHLQKCDRLIAISTFTRNRVLEYPGPWPACDIVHPHGDLVDPAVQSDDPPAGLRLLTVARLNRDWEYKGHRLTLQALEEMRSVGRLPATLQWRIVGGGDDADALVDEVRRAGLEGSVKMLGRLSDEDLESEYRACSVFIMPSAASVLPSGLATGEGFGIVYVEAANAGRASIGCGEGGQADIIENGVTGWLVRPDASEIARLLMRLADSPDEVRNAGRAAHARACEKFGADRFRESLGKALSACLAGCR
jgi:glycosyltransferase involved in cell wall biosynthesis